MNLTEFRLVEKIKLSYLRNRGNITAIVDEVGLPVEYIRKLVKKFRGKEERDVKTLIANTLMSHILLGSQSRITHLMETLNSLRGRERIIVSSCCESPLETEKDSSGHSVCAFCKKPTVLKELDREKILDIKLRIIQELREEDLELINCAKSLGYTAKEEPVIPQINQTNLIFSNTGKSPEQQSVFRDILNLSGLERDVLAEGLQREVTEIDIVKE